MYRIIGGDGREYGPVTGDTIRQWVIQNRANAKTLVRAENAADWRPLGETPEFASSFGAPPPQPPPDGPVPAPTQRQTVQEEDLTVLTAALVARDYDLGFGECLGNAFNLLGRKFWQAVGGVFLVMLCAIVLGMIPFLGALSNLLLGQVFYGGLYFYLMKLVRDEPNTIGDAFSGFSRSFGQLVLLSLVMNILLCVIAIPMCVPILGIALWHWNPWVMAPLAFVLALPVIYLGVGWFFSGMLVIDRGYEFWDAMELSRKMVGKHWFGVFFLSLIAGIIGGLGVIAFFVGIFFTLPITFATMVYAYERIFPRVGPNETPATPTTPEV